MKRTAIILGIAAAVALTPSVASGGNVAQVVKAEVVKAHVVKAAVVKASVVKAQPVQAAVTIQRVRAHRASRGGVFTPYPH